MYCVRQVGGQLPHLKHSCFLKLPGLPDGFATSKKPEGGLEVPALSPSLHGALTAVMRPSPRQHAAAAALVWQQALTMLSCLHGMCDFCHATYLNNLGSWEAMTGG